MAAHEVRHTLDAAGPIIGDLTADWKERLEALRRVRGMLEGPGAQHPAIVSLAREHLKEPFNTQLKDLRSAIVREVCGCIQTCCDRLPAPQWELLSDWWLPALFKCAFATVSGVAEAGSGALRHVVLRGRLNPRAVACVLQHTQHKHSLCRTRAYECTLLLLQVHSQQTLERSQEALENALRSGVYDGTPEVRQAARLMWWAYRDAFPERAERLLAEWDAPVQRAVGEDETPYQRLERPERLPDDTPPKKTGTPPAARAARPGQPPDRPAALQPEARTPPSAGATTAKRKATTPVRPKAAAVPDAPFRKLLEHLDEAAEPPSLRAAGPPGTSSPTSSTGPTPHEVPTAVLTETPETPDKALLSQASMETPSPPSRSSSGQAAAASPDEGSPASDPEDHDPRSPSPPSFRPRPVPEEWAVIAGWANDSVWSTRVRFFDTLVSLAMGPRMSEITQHFDKVMAAVLEHLGDRHYKVVLADLSALIHLVPRYSNALDFYLEPLFSQLFLRHADTKDAVRRLAGLALDTLHRALQPPAALVPSLLKVLDTNNSRVRCLCVEYLHLVLEDCEKYVSHPPTMKMILHKLLAISMPSGRAFDVERLCTSALCKLHALQPAVFLGQAVNLTPVEVSELRDRTLAAIANSPLHPAAPESPTAAPARRAESPSGDKPEDKSPAQRQLLDEAPTVEPEEAAPEPRRLCPAPTSPPASRPTSPGPPAPPPPSGPSDPPDASPTLVSSSRAQNALSSAMPLAQSYDPTAYRSVVCPTSLYAAELPEPGPWPVPAPSPPLSPAPQTAPTGDASGEPTMRDLVDRLAGAATAEHRRDALQGLLLATAPEFEGETELGAFAWAADLPALLHPLLRSTSDVDFTVQVTAAHIVRHLLTTHPAECEAHVEAFALALVALCQSPFRELTDVAEDALRGLPAQMAPGKVVDALLLALSSRPANPQVPIETLGRALVRLSPEEAETRAPRFMLPLYEGFHSPSADVRKAVVGCLVDAGEVLGARLDTWLLPLPAPQQKLVALCRARHQSETQSQPPA